MTASDGLWLSMARVVPVPRPAVWRAMTARMSSPNGGGRRASPRRASTSSLALARASESPCSLRKVSSSTSSATSARSILPLAFATRSCGTHQTRDRETVVTLTLHDSGEQTEVKLMQGEFATQERLNLHQDGWRESFEKLAALLA